ncbi:WD40 repeat-containing protein [Cylindrospermum stagnale PCC 7417]|uniref:WD40 repeat-containing protein n=1 Tax=Cylindrospermum stagnale PCC 7417 TaxID=56107 RepID=K9X1V1_9NOST|nr:WD40 repeat domain-containing protein [Cylindrospermum stagnale]AFZ26458.1 WD40 repeat-containing protein [Cylindrospermum stagnale PCC 7417]
MNNRIITLNNPHAIGTLDISLNGSMLVVGQLDDGNGTYPIVTLRSLPSLDILTEIKQVDGVAIESAIFTPDGNKLVYLKDATNVSIYDLTTQQVLKFGLYAERVIWLAAAKTSPRILTAGSTIDIWDLEQPERYWIWEVPDYEIPPDMRPALADISPDGTKVAVVGNNTNQVLIYDIDQNEIVQVLEDAPLQAHWAKFSPDMRYFAAIGYYANGVYVWDLTTGKRHLPDIFSVDDITSRSLCFHPSSKYLAIGTQGSIVNIYRMSDGEDIVSLEYLDIGQIEGLAFTPDGKHLCSGGFKGLLSILELNGLDEF